MSATQTTDQTQAFDDADYADPRLRLDQVDGKDVNKISVRFSGTVELTRTNPDHVALFRRLVLGKEIDVAELLAPTGRVVGRQNRQVLGSDGYVTDLVQTAVVSVTNIGGFAADPKPGDDGYDDPGQE